MNNALLKLAKLVQEELKECNAEIQLVPEFTLRQLEKMKVVIVPFDIEYKVLSRNKKEQILRLQIGVLKRATEDDIEEMLTFVSEMGFNLLGKKFNDVYCQTVLYNPLYSPDKMRENRQFTCVMELTFLKLN
jgi:hypothetical protein